MSKVNPVSKANATRASIPGNQGPLVIISGLPGSGKTSLARPLAAGLGVPLISKDVIKEVLGDLLGAKNVEESRRLGRASIQVMLAVARDTPRAVLDSHWHHEFNHELLALHRPLLELFCACPAEIALAREKARAETSRHPVHHDLERRTRPPSDLAQTLEARPLALGPFLEVDTTNAVDIDRVSAWVRQQPEWSEDGPPN